jgi:hypothetical protein
MSSVLVSFAFGIVLVPQVPSGPVLGRAPARDKSGDDRTRSLFDSHAPRLTPPDQKDVEVNSVSSADQDETPIRVDPTDRLHLIAGANDDRSGPYLCACYASFDGGLKWSETFMSDPGGLPNQSDPGVAFGPNGETYFSGVAFNNIGSKTHIDVGFSPDGGKSVPTWVEAVVNGRNEFEDKPFIVADQTTGTFSGRLYVTWTHFKSNGASPIDEVYSSDNGKTWSTPVQVSSGNFCQGSCPAIGPNGEFDVAYYDFGDNSVKFNSSVDGGVTWGTAVKVAGVSFLSGIPHTTFRTNSFPAMSVDRSGGPYDGNIYVVWAEDLGGGQGPDVLFARSTDGGAHWSNKLDASDVTSNSQFFPWVDVDVNGNVNFGFYDMREDPNDRAQKYYVSRSSDGGNTLLPNVAASDTGFNTNNYNQGGFIGDYTGIAASDRALHPIWTDGRNSNNNAFTSSIQFDMSTDVSTISAATGGTVNFTLNAGPLFQSDAYRVLGSISGTSPGINFGGVNVPLNFDVFLLDTILFANSSALQNFVGSLDATGSASAALVTGPLPPSAAGVAMDFAFFVTVGHPVKWASDPTHVSIVP